MDSQTYKRALIRNLNETGMAILEYRALVGLEKADSYHYWDFFRVAYKALFNDIIAHSVKVLDTDKRSATFWSLYAAKKDVVDAFAKEKSYDLDFLKALSGRSKLKHIRDKTLFHIDKNAVLEPKKVWKTARIKGKELISALESVWDILQYLHLKEFRKQLPLPDYDGSDATKIIEVWELQKPTQSQEEDILSYLFDKG